MKYGREDNLIAQKLKQQGQSFLDSKEWKELRRSVVATYGRKCMKCGSTPKSPKMTHVDHIKCRKKHPELSLDFNNLQVLCCRCNKQKGNQHQTDYRNSTLGELWTKGNEMNKKQAHIILDEAKKNRYVPIKQINEALITLGDLDVREVDSDTYEALRRDGNESPYRRTRSLPSPSFTR